MKQVGTKSKIIEAKRWDHHTYKRRIEKETAELILGKGTVVAITGPAINTHLKNLYSITENGKYPFIIYERESEIYKILCRKINTEKYNNVHLILDDVFSFLNNSLATEIKYLHLDFCKSITGLIKEGLLSSFAHICSKKCFKRIWYLDITISTRGPGGKVFAIELLDKFIPAMLRAYGWRLSCPREDDFTKGYRDGTPMLTALYRVSMDKITYNKFQTRKGGWITTREEK